MPGLFGIIDFVSSGSFSEISKKSLSIDALFHSFVFNNYTLRILKNSKDCQVYEDGKIFILYEGVILSQAHSKYQAAKILSEKYLSDGEHFVDNLRGTFQIVLIDTRDSNPRFFLYSDHVASRQIFYATTKERFLFSSDVNKLVPNLPVRSIDQLSMVHFMVAGHFPSGQTAIGEIKILGPGEYLAIKDKNIKKRRFFQFNFQPNEQMDIHEASTSLNRVLTERIIAHWKQAESPAILLSGGYDSQYIFNTIAESVEDASKLTTITWGQNPEKPFADMFIARRIAKRFGTRHLEISKTTDNWKPEYEDMFIAQNGMTDSSFYHAHELTVCKRLRHEYGIRSVIRGDECLGFGPEASTVQHALLTNRMSFPKYIHGFSNWFQVGNPIVENYTHFMEDFIDKYQYQSFDCLKDLLDFYERQHMNRNPLNCYKLHHLEVFCPLIDPDVLNLISVFPSKFRRHKQLFKKITRAKIGIHFEIAEYTNLTDWSSVLGGSYEIKNFFRQEFSNLPYFFNPHFFYNLAHGLKNRPTGKSFKSRIKDGIRPLKRILPIENLKQTLTDKRKYANPTLNIPAHMLCIRAAVLSRWIDWWVTDNSG